jgi:hypothetical protein
MHSSQTKKISVQAHSTVGTRNFLDEIIALANKYCSMQPVSIIISINCTKELAVGAPAAATRAFTIRTPLADVTCESYNTSQDKLT